MGFLGMDEIHAFAVPHYRKAIASLRLILYNFYIKYMMLREQLLYYDFQVEAYGLLRL